MKSPADLARTFRALDHVFFGDSCSGAGWRARWVKFRPGKTSFVFGECRDNTSTFALNVRLAHPDVPEYVVSAVLYHEMLHHVIGYDHDVDFFQAEVRHPHYWASERWCENFIKQGTWHLAA